MALKMEFLSNLNKGKEPTEMERVEANIAQVEAEVQQRYYQLGQMYYEEHKADGDTGDKYSGAGPDDVRKLRWNYSVWKHLLQYLRTKGG